MTMSFQGGVKAKESSQHDVSKHVIESRFSCERYINGMIGLD